MGHPLGVRPGKIIAVHVNYRSRARERGRVPAEPSYFLKPSSSLAGSGDPIVRPRGCALLAFEGEVALVIGETARRVAPEDGWAHVQWVTAANDAGVHDMRWADRGSNLRSKGADGFTPIGPRLLDARAIDPASVRLRTWVNGDLVQEGAGDELLFSYGYLVADLSRLVTLDPGDVILCGTPSGATVMEPGDVVEVEVTASAADGERSSGRLRNPATEADHDLAAYGAQPKVTADALAAAYGPAAHPALPGDLRAKLTRVATATLSSLLLKRGLANMSLDGLRPVLPDAKLVGTARTLRYLPLREDLAQRHGAGFNAQKQAIDGVGAGEVLVMDARRDPTAGTLGDILALRARERGAAGIVTDGGLRDSAAVRALGMPVYYSAEHPAVLGRRHVPWDRDIPVACGGALVQPGDILVGDADGVVLLPPDTAAELADAAIEHELQEEFVTEHVASGASVEGLYPIGPEWRPAYEAWRAERT
ncbi:MAG TPA: fumarylacetoacetate hydrolase family protein [Streptosporangiaceae bacterium]|jgi:2-keto-4-pentenoate hydratase/2-oxohepta-3-ene-1,7-dioic acid hydratase in catechol pathway/regulator of RNase E activity RraA